MMLQHGLSEDSSYTSYTINQSLRLRASNSANLSRTYTSNATWTFSIWLKRGARAVISPILGDTIKFNANDTLTAVGLTTTAVFRDPSAWYHIHVSNGGLYVNGVSFGAVTTSALTNTKIGTNGTNYFDGYIAHPYFIDSTSSSYNNFGITDTVTGIWIPKAFSGSYGTTGGFWPFNDATSLTTLGYDRSGNGNNWTCNGISITAGATYDVMKDSPTNGAGEVGNYATLNPLYTGRSTLTNGNLTASGTTDLPTIIPSSGTWYFEINGVSKTWTPPAAFPAAAGNYNFGQQPFTNTATYPTLHTGNLPVPTVKNGSDHFQVKLDTGANIKTTCEAVFTNELEWIKDRANANNHQLIDSVRGSNAVLQSNTTAAETTYSAPSGSSVGWVWRASDSAPVTNTDGSITSTVSANVAAGFSVVTAITPSSGVASYGHGLGITPSMVIIKGRAGTASWQVYHISMGISYRMTLESTSGRIGTTYFTAFNSTLLQFDTALVNGLSGFVAYCFAEIPGYSKFGSYTGNGSADGPFVYCGFRPAFILIKASSTTGSWAVLDSSRDGYNVDNDPLYANKTALEATADLIDILSNGFKLRSTDADVNGANTYIFAAFAASPFSSNNRAR